MAELCRNLTALLARLQPGRPDLPLPAAPNTTGPDSPSQQAERDRHAILYIVVVLLFYSLGIIIAIVMYLKREKEEIVEEVAYDNYMNIRADPGRAATHFRVQKMIALLQEVEREAD